jgi:hypothetical protein
MSNPGRWADARDTNDNRHAARCSVGENREGADTRRAMLYDRHIARREDIAARIAELLWRRRSAAAASIRELLQLESERIGIRETAPMMFRAEWRYRRGFVEP